MWDRERLDALLAGFSLHRIVMVTSLFIIAYSGFTVFANVTRGYQLSAQTRELQKAIAKDQAEYAQLQALKQYMSTDGFIETQAREEGLSLPGDTIVVVSAPTAPAASQDTPAGAWWERYYGR
jgi:cell division protein FtsL